MRKITIIPTNRLKRNESYEGKSIEQQLRLIKEGITIEFHNKPELFTARKDGVLPHTDIKTDRFELLQEANDKITRTLINKRKEYENNKSTETGKEPGESIQAQVTNNQ